MRAGYVSILNEEFRRRQKRNSNYSLRAFASFLGLDSSALSRVLNNKQELSVKTAAQVVRKLNLPPAELEQFIVSVARTRYMQALAELCDQTEITGHKAALRASEEHFRALFEHMDQLVALCELVRDERGQAIDYVIWRVNPAAEHQTGVRFEAVVGRPVREWQPNLNPTWVDGFARVVAQRRPETQVVYSVDLGAWFELYVQATEEDRFLVLGRNVTERKRREEELRRRAHHLDSIANALPDLLWIADPGGRSIWFNRRWFEYTGQVEPEVGERAWAEVIHPGDRANCLALFEEAVRTESPRSAEARIRGGGGDFRRFAIRAEPVFDAEAKLWQVYAVATEVETSSAGRD